MTDRVAHTRELIRIQMMLRKVFCGSLALAVIVSGRVRRAKKSILSSNLITAIYFHNPNKRLFARCVRWLIKNGYTFISHHELIKILHQGVEPPRGAVWLSFDDAFKELLENVVPIARQLHVPVTIFVPSGIVDSDGLFPWLDSKVRDAITVADVKEIAKYPEVSMGSHTVGHTVIVNLSDEEVHRELEKSKRMLEAWTGAPITAFAYPEGRSDGCETLLLTKSGYQLAATSAPMFVTQGTNPYFVPRFHVGDNFPFPEAICNMVGSWRPVIDPFIRIRQRCADVAGYFRRPLSRQYRARNESSI